MMTPPSNEVLAVEIKNMDDKIWDIKESQTLTNLKLDSIVRKLDWLSKTYVTRLEFKAASAIVGILAVVLGIIWYFGGN